MPRLQNHTFDTLLVLKVAAAETASGDEALIIDTRGNGAGGVVVGHKNDLESSAVRGDILIDVSALKISANDEVYTIVLQASEDAAFGTAANIIDLLSINLSAKEVKVTDSDRDDVFPLRLSIPFSNVWDGVAKRYLRLYNVIAGTSPSITYEARMGLGQV